MISLESKIIDGTEDVRRMFSIEIIGRLDKVARFIEDMVLDTEIEKDRHGRNVKINILENGFVSGQEEDRPPLGLSEEEGITCALEEMAKIGQRCKNCS